MNKIEEYNIPPHLNKLYKEEASSVIALSKEIADKVNELVGAYNFLMEDDLNKKQEQDGRINKAVLYMKDNIINSLNELLKAYTPNVILNHLASALDFLIVTPQMFGSFGDGFRNDTEAIEKAIEHIKDGGILYFPKGTYRMTGKAVSINYPNISFMGEGKIICDYGFRPKASNFKCVGLTFVNEQKIPELEHRAFNIDNSMSKTEDENISNFIFKDCSFYNYFYSISAIGGDYNYSGTEETRGYPVRDVVIENCYSENSTESNCGHFQCIQVENISYINNRTYGGTTASSYNAIKGNGSIRIIGNYDHNNKYASCEIENGTGKAIVTNNTFNSKIWIDDSYDVIVNANTTESGISITVGSNVGDSNNIIISNNVTKNIRCEQFGTYKGGLIKNIIITGNTVKGDNTHGIWIHGNAVKFAKISNNLITGTNTSNDIAIQRNEQLECYIISNIGNGKNLLIAGSGGNVFAIDNYNVSVSGIRNSLPVSHYEREFNGLRVTDETGVSWRLGVTTAGIVEATKY